MNEQIHKLLRELQSYLIDEECEGGRDMFHKAHELENLLDKYCPCPSEPTCDPCVAAGSGHIDSDGQPVDIPLGANQNGGECFVGCLCMIKVRA